MKSEWRKGQSWAFYWGVFDEKNLDKRRVGIEKKEGWKALAARLGGGPNLTRHEPDVQVRPQLKESTAKKKKT